jgi:hypothetical protein
MGVVVCMRHILRLLTDAAEAGFKCFGTQEDRRPERAGRVAVAKKVTAHRAQSTVPR